MNWEAEAVLWANGLVGRSAILDALMWQLSEGWLPFAILAAFIALWIWRRRRQALAPIAVLAGAILLGDFIGARLKALIGRPRPCRALEEWNNLGGCGGAFAMPSNHVLNMAVGAGFLQVLYPRSGWVLWPLVVVQAFSRVFMAAHYPSDVLVGGLLGAGIGLAIGFAFRRWRESRSVVSLPEGGSA